MTLREICLGLAGIMSEKTDIEHVTIEDVSQSSHEEFLHIQIIPLNSRTAGAGYFIDKEILIDIAYMEKLHTDSKRIYEVLEMLDGAFKPFFRIGDRAFTCDGQMDVTDDIGHYKMILKFTDSVPFMPEELAGGLDMDWRKENGFT